MQQVRAGTEEVYPHLSERRGDSSCLCLTCLCLTSPTLHLPSGAFPSEAHFCSAWDAQSQRESPFLHPGTSCSQLRFLSPIQQGPWKTQCPPLCPSGHLSLHLLNLESWCQDPPPGSGVDVAKAMPHWPDPGGIAVLITSALEHRTKTKVNIFKGPRCIRGLSALPTASCGQSCGFFWLNNLFIRKKEKKKDILL